MQSLNTRQLARALLVALCLFAPGLSMAQEQQYGSDYIIVAPGMTLTRIMREYYPQHRNHWPALMDEIVRINPHAFVNDAPASLKRGMRLTLPKEVPSTRSAQSTGTVAPPTATTTQIAAPAAAVSATAAVSSTSQSTGTTAATGSAARTTTSSAAQSSAPQQAAATTQQQPAIQGTSQVTAQEPVAALPPPIENETDDDGDQGTVGEGEVVAQDAPESGFKERPPWWWIVSALVMLALVL